MEAQLLRQTIAAHLETIRQKDKRIVQLEMAASIQDHIIKLLVGGIDKLADPEEIEHLVNVVKHELMKESGIDVKLKGGFLYYFVQELTHNDIKYIGELKIHKCSNHYHLEPMINGKHIKLDGHDYENNQYVQVADLVGGIVTVAHIMQREMVAENIVTLARREVVAPPSDKKIFVGKC